MLFVPLPLFATLILIFVLGRFILSRDMTIRAHQFFAALLGLYAIQSLLICLRWGYDMQVVAIYVAVLAPVLPAVAYLAYRALSGRQSGVLLWPIGVIAVNWIVFVSQPVLADPLILMTYLGFGGMLLRLGWKGPDHLSLSPINDGREIIWAMCLTGGALVLSGLTDVFLIYDFINHAGRNAPVVVTFVQTGFVLAIGLSALSGRAIGQVDDGPQAQTAPEATQADNDIVARLEALFETERLHLNEDLTLRRLSRRLGLSDRQVSNAINRVREMSVSQFVNAPRIKEACRLLTSTDKTVLEVSLLAGFATKSNFNRVFHDVTGMTPSRWRRDPRT